MLVRVRAKPGVEVIGPSRNGPGQTLFPHVEKSLDLKAGCLVYKASKIRGAKTIVLLAAASHGILSIPFERISTA